MTRVARGGAALLMVGALTACGAVSDLIPQENDFAQGSAQEIFAAAKKDIASTEAVHVSGSLRDGGKSASVDLSVSRSGNCRGSVTIEGMQLDLLVSEKRVFFRPDEAYFRRFGQSPVQAKLAVAQLGDRWLEDDTKKLGELCDIDVAFSMSDHGLTKLRKELPGTVTVTDSVEIMGVEAVQLSSTGAKGNYSMYVAADEPHHVLQLTAIGTRNNDGALTYTDHGAPVNTEVPAPDQIVKIPTP